MDLSHLCHPDAKTDKEAGKAQNKAIKAELNRTEYTRRSGGGQWAGPHVELLFGRGFPIAPGFCVRCFAGGQAVGFAEKFHHPAFVFGELSLVAGECVEGSDVGCNLSVRPIEYIQRQ